MGKIDMCLRVLSRRRGMSMLGQKANWGIAEARLKKRCPEADSRSSKCDMLRGKIDKALGYPESDAAPETRSENYEIIQRNSDASLDIRRY